MLSELKWIKVDWNVNHQCIRIKWSWIVSSWPHFLEINLGLKVNPALIFLFGGGGVFLIRSKDPRLAYSEIFLKFHRNIVNCHFALPNKMESEC